MAVAVRQISLTNGVVVAWVVWPEHVSGTRIISVRSSHHWRPFSDPTNDNHVHHVVKFVFNGYNLISRIKNKNAEIIYVTIAAASSC